MIQKVREQRVDRTTDWLRVNGEIGRQRYFIQTV
ncbi:hypothetical protein FHS27_000237 [Rhodopirellula rubra]|uniref:Uncharacterized protein n=1 Tax=Aporhodopirellula rubra TaxID=980271 RepID=A0A7W5H3T6_9BACT|nr:hypothetical protein [Aporhodopirellula rubra]